MRVSSGLGVEVIWFYLVNFWARLNNSSNNNISNGNNDNNSSSGNSSNSSSNSSNRNNNNNNSNNRWRHVNGACEAFGRLLGAPWGRSGGAFECFGGAPMRGRLLGGSIAQGGDK